MIAAAFLSLFFAGSNAQQELLVQTTKGSVQGHYNSVGVREWMGIPYAKPPVGELRWQSPQESNPFTEVYQADFLAPACAQTCKLPPGNCPDLSGISEDCLYVSVWAPTEEAKDSEGYPVFVWIHGGAYEQGMGNCALYNGTNFAENNVITVVMNYRLGALGFMASENMEGNYGHLDQVAALQWVNDNIANFGGNPSKVTIGGQSAGGMSVAAHMISSKSKGLFQQVIMESNPLGLPFHERESATQNANDMFEYLNCATNDVDCMRSKSVEEILDAQDHAVKLNLRNLFINFLPFAPLVEPNGLIPEQPLFAMMRGEFDDISLLSGSVLDEGQLFVYELFTSPINEETYKAVIAATFGVKNYPEIMRLYPLDIVPGSQDGREAMNILATDLLFYCPLRNVTRGYQAAHGEDAKPTFIYQVEHVMSFDCWGPGYEFCVGSVCHGSELPFVFNVFTDGVSVDYEPNADEVQLTTDISHAWKNFISHGNPNKGTSVNKVYPAYDAKTDSIIQLDEPSTTLASHYREKYCDVWDRLGFFY